MGRRGKGRTAKGAARGRLGMGFGKKSKNEAGDLLDRQEEDIERLRKKTAAELHEKELAKQPHTLVIHRGQVGKYVKGLEMDLRNIMSPNTAKNLKIRKNNNVKDFLVNGVVMGVTNMMILTASEKSLQLRMMRFSQGPTLTFRVKQYSISRHVLSAQKRPVVFEKLFQRLPLVVMNGFTKGSKHLQLVQTYIQNMFPSLNVDTIDLRDVKRCLMVNYNEEDDTVDIRHYALRVVASGLSKSSKKLVQAGKSSTKALPDLSRYKDISDYFLNPGQLSDSEFEGEQQEVELGQDIHTKGGCVRGEKSNVRLMEIGPRLSLELLKIEEGIDEGEVLYHKFIEKSSEEILQTRKQAPIQQRIKKRRETEEQQRVIRRLTAAQERRDREEAEVKAIIEKAARKQAAATGQAEDIENQKEKDREIAMNRERDLKRDGEENANEDEAPMKRRRMGPHARSSGGFGNRGGDRFSGGFEEGGSSRGGWRNGGETSSRGGRGFGGDRGGFRGRGGDGGFRGRDGDGGFRGRGGDRGGFRGRGGDGGFRGRGGDGGFRGRGGDGGFRGRGGSDGGFRGRGGGRGFGGRGGGRGDRDSGSSFRGRRGSF